MGLVERQPGEPAAQRAPRTARCEGEAASAALRARRPVLLVDGPGWDREALADALREAGFRPMTLPGPERAVAHARDARPRFEALLVPAGLRGGPEALVERLRALGVELPVHVVGAERGPAEVLAALGA